MVIIATVLITFPRELIGLFVDRTDPANEPVVEMATLFLAFAALFQIADGSQAVGAGMLRGLHDTRVPMVIAAVGYWGIGVPASVALAFWGGLAGAGVWLGLALGLFIVAALFLARWLHRDRFLDARFAAFTPP
jgi:MATE family multidrug resistance protein